MEKLIMKKIALNKSQEAKSEIKKKDERTSKKEVDAPRLSIDYLEQTLQIA